MKSPGGRLACTGKMSFFPYGLLVKQRGICEKNLPLSVPFQSGLTKLVTYS